MKSYIELGLNEMSHIMAQAHPAYTRLSEKHEEFVITDRAKRLTDREHLTLKLEIDRIISEDFVTLLEASGIMDASSRQLRKEVASGAMVGVIWQSKLYILKASLVERGHNVG